MENSMIEEPERYEDLRDAGLSQMRHEARIRDTFTPAYIRDTPLVLSAELPEEERCLECDCVFCECAEFEEDDEPGNDDRDEFDEGKC